MGDKDTPNIGQYLAGQLSEADKLAFEHRMAEDADFGEEVRLHALALRAVQHQGREELREALRQNRAAAPSPKPGRAVWPFLVGLGLLSVVVFFFWQKPAPTETLPSPAPPTSPVQEQLPPPDTPAALTPLPPKEKGTENQQLFASNFRAFESEELQSMLRGGDEGDAFHLFAQAYLEKRYKEAVRRFEAMPDDDQKSENILFLKANALLASGQAKAALPILDNMVALKTSRFVPEAEWYLALAHLQMGNMKKAAAQLSSIAKDPVHPRQRAAASLLLSLQ